MLKRGKYINQAKSEPVGCWSNLGILHLSNKTYGRLNPCLSRKFNLTSQNSKAGQIVENPKFGKKLRLSSIWARIIINTPKLIQ